MSENKFESFKIVLLGESGVGKSSILYQYIDQIFKSDLPCSTGGAFSSKTFVYGNNKTLQFDIWDTAGQERYRSLTKMFYKDAGSAILVYDVTKKSTFEEIKEYWLGEVREFGPSNLILVICANKTDLIDKEEVDESEAREFAEENGALFFRTSAKSYESVEALFYGIAKKYTDDDKIRLNERNPSEDTNNSINPDKTRTFGSIIIESKRKKDCCK